MFNVLLHGWLINPRRACARVTYLLTLGAHAQRGLLQLSCVYIIMCVCPLIPAASHFWITKERYQRILRNTGIVLNFADFPKNASFKNYGVICLPREQLQRPSAFSPRNKLLCWFEAYSYIFIAQTTGLWKTACDSLAHTRETAQIYGSRILIATPTSA